MAVPSPAPQVTNAHSGFPLPATPQHENAGGVNVLAAARRRWPWLIVGVVIGVGFAFLYYSKQAPVYKSTAQLLVIKNRPEIVNGAGGVGDVRTAYVEDYVETQLTLLKSRQIMQSAARQLDRQGGFSDPLPHDLNDRIGMLSNQFTVTREREQGSTTPGNVLALATTGSHPSDTPKYLKAIIEAYRAELDTLYEEASTQRLTALDKDIALHEGEKNRLELERQRFVDQLKAVSLEEPTGIKNRITLNRDSISKLRIQKRGVERDLELVARTGASRTERLQTMDKLGVKPIATSAALDTRSPEAIRLALDLQKVELSDRVGPEHPEMKALDSRIKFLEALLERQGIGSKAEVGDELDRHRLKLEAERDALADQLQELETSVTADEAKATKMFTAADKIERLKQSMDRLDDKVKDRQLERTQILGTRTGGGYRVQAITPPDEGFRIAPVLSRSLMMGGFFGLLAGLGLSLLADLSDRSFRSPAEIQKRLGVRVLGHVPWIRKEEPSKNASKTGLDLSLAAFYRPSSIEAEAYRGVRTQIFFTMHQHSHPVIQVTSPSPSDGKSTLAANLAISIAQSGKRVVFLDCDFRKPRLHRLFNLSRPDVGLASVISGDATLETATQPSEVDNLWLLPCGPRPANPAELLTSPKFQEVLGELKSSYDFVIVDTPPLLAVTDPSIVAARVDGVVLVLRMSKTARPNAERAYEQLEAVAARTLGVVVNASITGGTGGYNSSYGYTYGYGYRESYQYSENYTAGEDDPSETPESQEMPAPKG